MGPPHQRRMKDPEGRLSWEEKVERWRKENHLEKKRNLLVYWEAAFLVGWETFPCNLLIQHQRCFRTFLWLSLFQFLSLYFPIFHTLSNANANHKISSTIPY